VVIVMVLTNMVARELQGKVMMVAQAGRNTTQVGAGEQAARDMMYL
jgi:hypothetical protein